MKVQTVARVAGILLAAPTFAQVTTRLSVSSTGVQANGNSFASGPTPMSADGRFVAFCSVATNIGGGTSIVGVYVRDRWLESTELLVPTSSSSQTSISADGRYVAYTDLDAHNRTQIWVRDRQTGTTQAVCVPSTGGAVDDRSTGPSISADGRCVAFFSFATNLVPDDTNGACDVFVRDLQAQTTERVSVSTGGVQGNAVSSLCSISGDGRYVAFQSNAQTLVASDTNGKWDVFLRDRALGTTEIVSVDSNGNQANDDSEDPSISSDGRHVAFWSLATNLVAGGTTTGQVFVRDRTTSTTELVSQSTNGVPADTPPTYAYDPPAISANGRYVTFASQARNLIDGQTTFSNQIFLRDRQNATTEIVDLSTGGAIADIGGVQPSITPDGRFVCFGSGSDNLVPGDTNGKNDVFLRDRNTTGATILCSPGVANVLTCPCSNPPSGPGRGCDNSAGTGGATLAVSGIAYLSMDSLAFTTSGELPTATSILLQGDALAASGIAYGRGVRCVTGTVTPLFTKSASGGSILAPDAPSGDPSVSERSAAKGDMIQPGQSRWYLVAYRDPIAACGVHGPSAVAVTTFDTTPTARVDWGP